MCKPTAQQFHNNNTLDTYKVGKLNYSFMSHINKRKACKKIKDIKTRVFQKESIFDPVWRMDDRKI